MNRTRAEAARNTCSAMARAGTEERPWTALDLARWQFGIVTVYHFLFVPLTIGLSFLVALMQTAWYRTGNAKYLGMTKFWGKLFLINFAHGRGHRDRAGVPVRDELERLLPLRRRRLRRAAGDRGADRVLPGGDVHRPVDLRLGPAAEAARIWPASGSSRIGTNLSAFFILAANSWMQHPVGFQINPERGRAELTEPLGGAQQLDEPGGVSRTWLTASFLTGCGVRHRDQRLAPAPPASTSRSCASR